MREQSYYIRVVDIVTSDQLYLALEVKGSNGTTRIKRYSFDHGISDLNAAILSKVKLEFGNANDSFYLLNSVSMEVKHGGR